jgi:hypothetical protein
LSCADAARLVATRELLMTNPSSDRDGGYLSGLAILSRRVRHVVDDGLRFRGSSQKTLFPILSLGMFHVADKNAITVDITLLQ